MVKRGDDLAYQANVLSVMIASPGDVTKERERVRAIIHDLNDLFASNTKRILLPVGWETHAAPELAGRAQEIINIKILDKCDILVGIFWTKLGTPTGTEQSGTVEEIKRHIAAGKPAMLYFSNAPVAPESLDPEKWGALQKFKVWCFSQGLVEQYDDLSDFSTKFHRQIQILLRDNDYLKSVTTRDDVVRAEIDVLAPAPITVALSEEASILLAEAVKGDGEIMNLAFLGGKLIQANGIDFAVPKDRRTIAKWEAAIEELENLGLVSALSFKREIFEVTNSGFKAMDTAVQVDVPA